MRVPDVDHPDEILDCQASGRLFPQIARDRAIGDSLGLEATPSIIVGTQLLTGAGEDGELHKRITSYLASALKHAR